LFDVCPDYAIDPAQRLEEFKALLERIHAHGLRVLLDFVANHVARSYYSRVRPDLNFGLRDDRGKFFDPRNNFFYLQAARRVAARARHRRPIASSLESGTSR